MEEEKYYFVMFEKDEKKYLLYGDNKTFPACETEELAKELCENMFWYTELRTDFVPILLSISEAKKLTGLPFMIYDFRRGRTVFKGVPIERSKNVQ